jgi:hypothetical protein
MYFIFFRNNQTWYARNHYLIRLILRNNMKNSTTKWLPPFDQKYGRLILSSCHWFLMEQYFVQAIQTIDTEIAQQLLRRKHRDGVGQTFFDANMYTQSPMGVVPEALRPKPGHLSVSQQRVYEVYTC